MLPNSWEGFLKMEDRKIIAQNMKVLIREKTTGKNKMRTISKKDIFDKIKGEEDDKEDVFKLLINDGEIFERKKGKYQWIGE